MNFLPNKHVFDSEITVSNGSLRIQNENIQQNESD